MNDGLSAPASPRPSCQGKCAPSRGPRLDHSGMRQGHSIALGNYHGT